MTAQVVEREAWLAARMALMAKEKELTRARDEVSALRRALPWVRVEKDYRFDTVEGPRMLPELFGDHSQLIVYHFMFGPDWSEGCDNCSFWTDGWSGNGVHLAHRDIAFTLSSRAPLPTLLAYKQRMGWDLPWISSLGSDFNFDYGVSFTPEQQHAGAIYNYGPIAEPNDELHGLSVFAKDAGGAVFHTYSCYARGLDPLNAAYQLMDLTPKGRDEDRLEWPTAWLRRHDSYE